MQTDVLIFWRLLDVDDDGYFCGLGDFDVVERDLCVAFKDFGDFL